MGDECHGQSDHHYPFEAADLSHTSSFLQFICFYICFMRTYDKDLYYKVLF